MANKSGRATIVDVALAARVSPATVSRVMNGRFAGEAEIAERVRRVAAELRYSPSHLARSLALGETRAVALVVPDLANPAFQAVLAGLTRAAAACSSPTRATPRRRSRRWRRRRAVGATRSCCAARA